ncbi:nuclear transport factor 2 family protein [Sphingomonas profundi]|uniref:nuclear transport factor 2 family protein n=1 Tax=Alterirhizorhabdus profundi TaxID=2681549 RepID=UPI001E625775|nr:nuclear transport factor 2 family protein [Sphingomonas profundi]
MDAAVRHLVDRQGIADCAMRYIRGQDRLDRALQESAFHPDATTDYGFFRGPAREFVAFAQDILRRYAKTSHLLGQMDIAIDDGTATGEIYFLAYHRRHGDEGPEDLVIAGRYLDLYERRDGEWRILHRREVVDWTRTDPASDGWLERTPHALTGGREGADPSDVALVRPSAGDRSR